MKPDFTVSRTLLKLWFMEDVSRRAYRAQYARGRGGRRSRLHVRAQYARVKVERSMRAKAGHCTRIMREVAGGDAVDVTRGRSPRRHALSAGGRRSRCYVRAHHARA